MVWYPLTNGEEEIFFSRISPNVELLEKKKLRKMVKGWMHRRSPGKA